MDKRTVPAAAMGASVAVPGASSLGAYGRCIRRDAPFHLFVLGYGVVAWWLSMALGVPQKFAPLVYMPVTATALPGIVWLVLLVLALRSLGTSHPLWTLRGKVLRTFDPEVAAGLALFGSLSVFIGIFSSVKTMLTDAAPFFADRALADLDRLLHLGRDPWTFTRLPPVLTNALELVYAGVWGLVVMGAMLAVLLVPRLRPLRAQFVWSFLLAWPLLGNLLAWAGLSAGPTFYAWVTGDGRFTEWTQHLEQVSIIQKHARQFLWDAYVQGKTVAGAGISAFPSMHVATATLVALLAARVSRGWSWAGLVFLATIQFGSVHLAWHYAVDGYCSMLVMAAVWVAVGRSLALRAGRSADPTRRQRASVARIEK